MSTMYAVKDGQMYVLRQERFRAQLAAGTVHPHDVCVVATTARQLHDMTMPHWPDADFSAIPEVLEEFST
jgi:hypothetical protein